MLGSYSVVAALLLGTACVARGAAPRQSILHWFY